MGIFSSLFGLKNDPKPERPSTPKIPLAMLEDMFANMRLKSKWNVDGDLLWGYFFTDNDPYKLAPVAKYLSAEGYRIVQTYPTDDDTTHVLHVERIEHHTPHSLYDRNRELETVATSFHIASYDGMDVGAVL